ncbi:hypothetical protein LOK49_LG01G00082 [Camellia lanceoleosa]|uniref:Uncharacterized protein n=1 Tax=Camellia lanceoleosa TaxID=1840588 RepID=A0ACC0IWU8_9ERIC|nr:hypothetical protein LOK49_LG01G00082 [Camellia lanceoleosa]
MNEQYWKKSGQIPAFGNWENANELPITQYFECARQAVSGGLLRYSNSSSGECHCHHYVSAGGGGGDQLRAIDFKKYPLPTTGLPPPPPKKKTRVINKRYPQVKEEKNQVKKVVLCAVPEPPRKPQKPHSSQKVQLPKHSTSTKITTSTTIHNRRQPPTATATATIVKAVDEDLYKIPPELLHKTKRKKRMGLFSRCLVPSCMV